MMDDLTGRGADNSASGVENIGMTTEEQLAATREYFETLINKDGWTPKALSTYYPDILSVELDADEFPSGFSIRGVELGVAFEKYAFGNVLTD